jgi:hypothetical protein
MDDGLMLTCQGMVMVETDFEQRNKPTHIVLTVRATVVQDGTHGISLSLGEYLIGEWTDSRARILSLTDDNKVRVGGVGDELLYLFSVPGKVLLGKKISDWEVVITFEL